MSSLSCKIVLRLLVAWLSRSLSNLSTPPSLINFVASSKGGASKPNFSASSNKGIKSCPLAKSGISSSLDCLASIGSIRLERSASIACNKSSSLLASSAIGEIAFLVSFQTLLKKRPTSEFQAQSSSNCDTGESNNQARSLP